MSAAQDEFNELMRYKGHRDRHPEDEADIDGSSAFASDRSIDGVSDTASDVELEYADRSRLGVDRSNIPTRRYEANTGPKGVISDAQDFRDARRNQRMSVRDTFSAAPSDPPLEIQDLTLSEKLDEEDDLDEGDGDFMKKWRQSRIDELKRGMKDGSMQNGQRSRLQGGLTAVDGEGYLEAVDGSPQDTVVVVYIFDELSQVSELFEGFIHVLAAKHQDTIFVKLHYEEAQMEPAGVPAIIAYRGGEKFGALVPIIDELPDDADLCSTTLEVILKRHQILI